MLDMDNNDSFVIMIIKEILFMYKKDYEKLILKRIDKNFDKVMPVGSVVAFGSAVAIYMSSIPNIFAIADIVIGLIFVLIYINRGGIKTEIKILVTIIIPIVLGIFSFLDGGFSSGTVTLILMSNAIAVLFLSKRKSAAIAILSLVSLFALWMWTISVSFNPVTLPNTAMWIIQILTIVLFLIVYQVAVYTIKNHLLENIVELEEAVEMTYSLAYYDQLTGLPNQNLFTEKIERCIEKGVQKGYLVLFSLKSLNVINSVYGMDIGNRVLVEVVRCLDKIKEADEILARVGGNEFLVWIEEAHWNEMDKNLDKVITSFFNEFEIEEVRSSIEYFVCYARFDSTSETIESVYQKVHVALTYAKEQDSIEMIAFDENFEALIRRKSDLRKLLKIGIENKEFELYYQTKVDATTEDILGVEALARWHTEVYGVIGPDEFIPMTEDMNLVVEFGMITVDKALSDYPSLCKKYGQDITISINISPTFLKYEGFSDYMITMIRDSGIRYDRIILEITEEIIIESIEVVNAKLKTLRSHGIKISLDDFGTGYSSLNYLSMLTVDEMKIDKALVDHICDDERSGILLETIIHLSKQYEMMLVAEGVETKAQRDKLIDVGCNIIQGYYYSRPEPLQ